MERNSNIEFLRIISMLFIVMGHFVDQTSFLTYDFTASGLLIAFLAYGARIATNVFLIVSVWFLYEKDFDAKRVIRMYLQLLFYSVTLTSFALIIGVSDIGIKDIARGYLPFLGRALWFVSAYITLYLFSPVLKKFFLLDIKLQKTFCLVSFVLICFVSTLPDPQNGYLIDSVWFSFVYLWIGTIKKSLIFNKLKPSTCLLGAIFIYSFLVIPYYFVQCHDVGLVAKVINLLGDQYIHDIKTLPNFICALLIFFAIISMQKRENRMINKVASYSFAVYLFHQVPAFYPVLWNTLFCAELLKNEYYGGDGHICFLGGVRDSCVC